MKYILLATIAISTITPYVAEAGQSGTVKNEETFGRAPQKIACKEKANSIDKAYKEQRILTIQNEIRYDYNFDKDDVNFQLGLSSEKGKTKRDYTVFINVHDGSFLNTTSTYKPGTRTLSWATPYEAAIHQAMSALKHAHDQSALLTEWTCDKLRSFVSFIIIPKNTLMEFKIGYAASQASKRTGKYAEETKGGGMQLRLKYLPVGAIVLSEPLSEAAPGSKLEDRTSYSLYHTLEKAISNYNKSHKDKPLPENIKDIDLQFVTDKNYVSESFETVNEAAQAPAPTN